MKMNFEMPNIVPDKSTPVDEKDENRDSVFSEYLKLTNEKAEKMIEKICATSSSEEEIREKIKLLGVEKDFVVGKLGTGNSVGIVIEYPDGINLLRKNFDLKKEQNDLKTAA